MSCCRYLYIYILGWVYKAIYAIAEDYVNSEFVDNQLYVDFILNKVLTFKDNKISLVLVFDGKSNSMKHETHQMRERERKKQLEIGHNLLKEMKTTIDEDNKNLIKNEAIKCFQKGIVVTREMQNIIIGAARMMDGVEVIVAPYEADAQLAYLCKIGKCQGVLTEDSDIIVYSVISGIPFSIFFNYDSQSQTIQEINLISIGIVDNNVTKHTNRSFLQMENFRGSSGCRLFVLMCILAGCDYLTSIKGIGLKRAHDAVINFKHDDLEGLLVYISNNGYSLPENYKSKVIQAEKQFYYHTVYNPECYLAYYSNIDVAYPSRNDAEFVCFESQQSTLQGLNDLNIIITPQKLCEGRFCCETFKAIPKAYPWEGKLYNDHTLSSCWAIRIKLMNTLGVDKDKHFIKSISNKRKDNHQEIDINKSKYPNLASGINDQSLKKVVPTEADLNLLKFMKNNNH